MSKLTELSHQKQKKRFSKYCNFTDIEYFFFKSLKILMKRLENLYHRDLSYDKLVHSKCRILRTFNIMDGCKLPLVLLENMCEHV